MINKVKFFAGHSLGEYTALNCSGWFINFEETLTILKREDKQCNLLFQKVREE